MRAGDALWALGRKKEACDTFTEAIKLEPENKDVIAAYSSHQKEYIGTETTWHHLHDRTILWSSH